MTRRSSATRHRQETGFTLIELLVVIVILAILAAVAVFAVQGTGDKGKAAAVTTDERTIRTAEEAFCAKEGRYGNAQELIDGRFLSDKPQYHRVDAVNTGGTCNGWSYAISATESGFPTAPGAFAEAVATPGLDNGAMIELADGRVLVLQSDANAQVSAGLYDPVAGTLSPTDPPPTQPNNGQKRSMVLLSGPRCALGGNCGKVLAHLIGPIAQRWWLFDPNGPVGSRWLNLTAPANSYSNNAVTGANGAVLLTGGPSECGTNCGKVFISSNNGSNPDPPAAELYDPADNSFEQIVYPRPSYQYYTDLAGLQDGRVLMQGYDCDATCGPMGVLFDPVDEQFRPDTSPGNDAVTIGSTPFAPVLPSGDVLFTHHLFNPSYPAQLYRPGSSRGPGQWSTVPTCTPDPSTLWCHTLTSLPDGKVLAVTGDFEFPYGLTGRTYLFDPIQQRWSRTADLLDPPNTNSPRWVLTLSNGKVLMAGSGRLSLFTP